jgi:hypothetical protein
VHMYGFMRAANALAEQIAHWKPAEKGRAGDKRSSELRSDLQNCHHEQHDTDDEKISIQ